MDAFDYNDDLAVDNTKIASECIDFLKREDIIEIAKWLESSKKFFLQQFKNNTSLISNKLQDIIPHSKEELVETLNDIKKYFEVCDVRGL